MMNRRDLIVSASALAVPGPRPPARPGDDFVATVLAALRRHRIVAVGEVHGLQEHHDALTMLFSNPRFADAGVDVVVEFGNARYQATADRFVGGEPVDNADLRRVWRDTTQSPLATWDAPIYEAVFRTIRASGRGGVRVLLGDPPVDWTAITTRQQISEYMRQRDSHAASVIQREVLARGRRALICYGASHVLHQSALLRALPCRPYVIASLAPVHGDPGGLFARLDGRRQRIAIPTRGTWLGDFDAGNVFPTPMRGPSGPVNSLCGVPLGSVIDAGLYLGQPDRLTLSRANPALYLDPDYWEELLRRKQIHGARFDLERYRTEQPVAYQPITLPPPLQCP